MKAPKPEADAVPLQEKFRLTREELSAALIERDAEVDLVLTALLAQEHALLVGPPGTAKSLLLDSLMAWMSGNRFSALLTRFSAPEELFGPVSVAALKEGRYVRITTGKLPEAHLVYLDEVFKGSSAILNTLLKVLNERTFDAGDGVPRKVSLRLCLAASNEWADEQDGGRELAALSDRFLLRRRVRPIVSGPGRQRLLWTRDHTPKLSTTVTPDEVDSAHREVKALPWSGEAKEAFEAILRELGREGVQPGDRRQYKSVAACQAFAYLCGASRVETGEGGPGGGEDVVILPSTSQVGQAGWPSTFWRQQCRLRSHYLLDTEDTGSTAEHRSCSGTVDLDHDAVLHDQGDGAELQAAQEVADGMPQGLIRLGRRRGLLQCRLVDGSLLVWRRRIQPKVRRCCRKDAPGEGASGKSGPDVIPYLQTELQKGLPQSAA